MNEIADPIITSTGGAGADLPCRRCGYNLRSLAVDGACPECGLPIEVSARGDSLALTDSNWLRRVASGLRLLWISGVIGDIAYCKIQYFSIGRSLTLQWIAVGAAIGGLAGYWIATTAEPFGVGEHDGSNWRRRLRILVGITISLIVWFRIRRILGFPQNIWLAVVISIYCILAVVTVIAEYSFLLRLAKRIPNQACATACRFLRVAYPIIVLILLGGVQYQVWSIVISRVNPLSQGPGRNFTLWADLMWLVLSIGSTILLIRMETLIRRAARMAASKSEAEQSLMRDGEGQQ